MGWQTFRFSAGRSYSRIADYLLDVLRRLSRERVVHVDEMKAVAWRLARKYSGNPSTTVDAVDLRFVTHAYRGRFSLRPWPQEMKPERAWEEGRQCIALGDKCYVTSCLRRAVRKEWMCPAHRKIKARAELLSRKRRELRSLQLKLERTIKEARRGHENRRAA